MEAQARDLLDQGFSEDHPQVQCIRALARASEEREAVMRKQWSDIDFQEGEESNKELLTHLERDFAGQLATVAAKHVAEEQDAYGAAAAAGRKQPWCHIKVSGGTSFGKTYLGANIVRKDGDVGLCGYDDESGRQRWRIEECAAEGQT